MRSSPVVAVPPRPGSSEGVRARLVGRRSINPDSPRAHLEPAEVDAHGLRAIGLYCESPNAKAIRPFDPLAPGG